MNRPFGITVIAILALISGLFGLCIPTLIIVGSAFLPPFLAAIGVTAGIIWAIGSVLQLIFAIGALNLRSWAWILGLISTGISVLGVIISLFRDASLLSAIAGSVLPVIIFIYLLTPNVRQAFGLASQVPAAVPPPAPVEPTPPIEPPAMSEPPAQGEDSQQG